MRLFLTLTYMISHVRLQLTMEGERREPIPNCSRYGNDLVLAALRTLTRGGRVAVVEKCCFSLQLGCSRPRFADILAFHNMTAYQFASSSIDFAVLYELKTHIAA